MESGKNTSRQLFYGAAILAIAAVIVKILSAVYRIPFQNMVGDTGFYIYQQVYPFFGIAVVLATYGFPVAVSKMLVDEDLSGKKGHSQIRFASFIWLLVIGISLFLLLFVGAPYIAGQMQDLNLTQLLRGVSYAFLLMPLISFIRGSFQGNGNMMPTAVSQTAEQVVRVLLILVSAYILLQNGHSLYKVAEWAIFGSVIGEVAAAGVLLLYLVRERQFAGSFVLPDKQVWKRTGKVLLLQGLAFSFSNMYMILLQLIDAFQLYAELVAGGMPAEQAKALKGIYDRGQPLIQVGLVVATSLSLSIVPILSSLKRQGKVEDVKEKSRLALRVSTSIGLGATFGLFAILKSVNIMLFEDGKGTDILAILALSIVLASLLLTCTAILQSLEFWKESVLVLLFSLAIKGMVNPIFISAYGTGGAALSTMLSVGMAVLILVYVLNKKVTNNPYEIRHVYIYIVAVIAMLATLFGIDLLFKLSFGEFTHSRGLAAFHAISAAILGGAVYVITLIRLKLFTYGELSLIPGGNRLSKFLPQNERDRSF